jgi:hypothetical protein
MNEAPRIWTRRPTILEPRRELILRAGLSGHFRLTVHKGDPARPRRVLDFDNLITTAGLDFIGGSTTYIERCAVGTGTNTPAITDTQLQTQIAATSTVMSTSTADEPSPGPYFGHATINFRFGQGVAAGNLTEIGVGKLSGTPVPLFSRARIVDDDGDPTTLTILSDEFLDVSYTLRIHPPTSDLVSTVVIGGLTYDFTLRASNVTNDNDWLPGPTGTFGGAPFSTGSVIVYQTQTLGAITATPAGTSTADAASVTNAAYSNGNFYRDWTASWGLTGGNMGLGIGALKTIMGTGALGVGRAGAFQMSFAKNPGGQTIPKDSTKIMSLTFRHSWDRHPET